LKRPNARSNDEDGEEPSSSADEMEEGKGARKGGPSEEQEPGEEEGYTVPTPTFSARIRRWARTYRFGISLFVLVLGLVLFFLGLFAWTPLASPGGPLSGLEAPLLGADAPSGGGTGPDWTLAMIPGGGLMAAIGGYLAGVYIIARRRFEHLMKTKSKAEFLRNVTEAEDLLWDLTPADEVRLVRKKQDLKIRG
jgi:hypothetical protein